MIEAKAGRERHVRAPKRPAAFHLLLGFTAVLLAGGVAWMLARA